MQMLKEIEVAESESNREGARVLPESLAALERLSWNYWWSWAADGASVFRDLDPEIWEECEHNPRLLLARVSEYRPAQMATDPVYIDRVRRLSDCFDQYIGPAESWSNQRGETTITPDRGVAY